MPMNDKKNPLVEMCCNFLIGLDSFINEKFEPKIANIFLYISLSICFGCLKEPSH